MPAGGVCVCVCVCVRVCLCIPALCVFHYGVKARAFDWDNSMSRWDTRSEILLVSQLILNRKRPHKLCEGRREFVALFYYCVYFYCYYVLF